MFIWANRIEKEIRKIPLHSKCIDAVGRFRNGKPLEKNAYVSVDPKDANKKSVWGPRQGVTQGRREKPYTFWISVVSVYAHTVV